jgi:tight adherence protein B
LGAPTEEALERLAVRASHPVYDTLVAAVLLHRDAGGDLAGLLAHLAEGMEAARAAQDDARVLTAQARLTARIVAGLPLVAGALVELTVPGSLRAVLSDPLAGAMAATAAILEVLALAAMQRLAAGGER